MKELVKPLSAFENIQATGSKNEVKATNLDSTVVMDTATLKRHELFRTEHSFMHDINSKGLKPQKNPPTDSDTSHDYASTQLPSMNFESPHATKSPSSSRTLPIESPEEPTLLSNEKQLIDINGTIPPLSSSTAAVSASPPSVPENLSPSPENLPSSPISKRRTPEGQYTISSSIVSGKCSSSKHNKGHIVEERSILYKLVSALDITLTFHAARNVAAFFHKIQPMLRNSTCKNVTLSHLCKILFVAPELYDVETKVLKEYGKHMEAHQVSFGSDWTVPLSGKMIQERKDIMTKRSGNYFEKHKETSTIPEKELPRMDNMVDKKKWLQNATLPDRVRSILELQEKQKAAKDEKANQPRMEPKGSAKDRAKALLDRVSENVII
ncbi:hypothetical protein BCR42DRAFT_23011 [Absidia repens]|uniref:CDT1 Geminin-binding domain-containing protein n=1 Tax=Absidia repens TaxID=90262 RepID=A0A1X2IHU9_9FUNG|nr:hypothetical protein BCR42DRAFT_23011 [Absidia repens]